MKANLLNAVLAGAVLMSGSYAWAAAGSLGGGHSAGGEVAGIAMAPGAAPQSNDQKLKEVARNYTNELSALVTTLGALKDAEGATAALPGIKDQVSQIKGYVTTLSGASDEAKSKIRAEFKTQMDAAATKFHGEVDRITMDPVLGKVKGLLDTLQGVTLFE